MQAGCCKCENAYDKAAQHLAHALGDSVAGGNPGIPYAAPAASQAAPPTLQPPRRLTGPYLKRSGFENENRFGDSLTAFMKRGSGQVFRTQIFGPLNRGRP